MTAIIDKKIPPFVTDLPPFAFDEKGFGSFKHFLDTAYGGQFDTGLLMLEDGLVYAPIGAYRVMHDRHKNVIILHNMDPEALAIEKVTVTQAILNQEKWPQSLLGRELGWRLKSVEPDTVTIYAGRKPKDKSWLADRIYADQHFLRDVNLRHGLLPMIGPNIWANDSIVYHLSQRREKRRLVHDKDGAPVYELRKYMSPGQGWELTHNFKKYFAGLSGKFMSAASIPVKTGRYNDCMNAMRDDFETHSPTIVAGLDPYADRFVPLSEKEREAVMEAMDRGAPPPRKRLKKIKGHKAKGNMFRLQTAVRHVPLLAFAVWGTATVLANLAVQLASLALFHTWSPLFIGIRASIQSMQRAYTVLFHEIDKTPRVISSRMEALFRKYSKGWDRSEQYADPKKAKQGWTNTQLRPPLDPKWRLYIGAVDKAHAGSDIGIGKPPVYEPTADWAKHKEMFNSTDDPAGSLVVKIKLGEHDGMHVVGANGSNSSYLPQVNMFISRMDNTRVTPQRRDDLTPREIVQLYNQAPADKPFLMITYANDTNTYSDGYMARDKYETLLEWVSRQSLVEQQEFPEKMPVDMPEPADSTPLTRTQKIFRVIAGNTSRAAEESSLEKAGEQLHHALTARGAGHEVVDALTKGMGGPH